MDDETSPTDAAAPTLFMTELRVADWETLVAWYARTLRLRVVLRDDRGRFALLASGTTRLALKGADDATPGNPRVRLVFQVADVDAEALRLQELGIEATAAADHPNEPYREVRLHDPGGVPITLFSWRT